MRTLPCLVLALGLTAGTTVAQAQTGNCDAIRAGIDAKIRASGATGYALTVVDADAKVPAGKVVGSCAVGTKKIVYAPADAAASAPRDEPILTECRDGTVKRGGDCPK